jgi:ferric-dicitrate binding protein FerR (iron transport regulator)
MSEIRILLMGYADGELGPEDRARVEEALAKDPELRKELAEMKRLKEATLGVDALTDADIEAFWGTVYNRLERRAGWILLLAGTAGVVGAGCYLFFTHEWAHWSVKLAGASGLVGTLVLVWSVWRERRRAMVHDRYAREVQR